ncbi:MAG: hypothetical protein DYG91_07155, partial [Chloroflexi bacterium CFX7]|nr:hypothetical protein [Chloroflexi bacterium CFX7]
RLLRLRGWRGPIIAMTANAFAEERQRCQCHRHAGNTALLLHLHCGHLFDTLQLRARPRTARN